MYNIYELNKNNIKKALFELWKYMKLNQQPEKSDLIIGCGCTNLDIPIKCVNLFKEGYAPKILFSGGFGKITKDIFNKPEAEIYKDIAIENGIDKENILVETKSTNTGDNFRFSKKLLEENNMKCSKIIIVHKQFDERRTISAAKTIFNNHSLIITSPDITFEEYLNILDSRPFDEIMNTISTIVGDVQRLVVYPQFGWQTEEVLTEEVKSAYHYLKNIGFSKFILSKEQIKSLIDTYGVIEGKKETYFN